METGSDHRPQLVPKRLATDVTSWDRRCNFMETSQIPILENENYYQIVFRIGVIRFILTDSSRISILELNITVL